MLQRAAKYVGLKELTAIFIFAISALLLKSSYRANNEEIEKNNEEMNKLMDKKI